MLHGVKNKEFMIECTTFNKVASGQEEVAQEACKIGVHQVGISYILSMRTDVFLSLI